MQKRATPTAIGRSGGLLRGVALPAPFFKTQRFLNFTIICKLLLVAAGQSNP